jgi:hypothetical protein
VLLRFAVRSTSSKGLHEDAREEEHVTDVSFFELLTPQQSQLFLGERRSRQHHQIFVCFLENTRKM